MFRSAVLESSQRPFALDGESVADCLDCRRTTVARGPRRNREQASALHSMPAPAPQLPRSRLRRPSGLTGGAAPAAATPLRRKPLLLFASPRELPNRTTIKELRWRQRPMRRQPRGDEHGPPSSGPMVNGVKTHMVNGRLIGTAAAAPAPQVPLPLGFALVAAPRRNDQQGEYDKGHEFGLPGPARH